MTMQSRPYAKQRRPHAISYVQALAQKALEQMLPPFQSGALSVQLPSGHLIDRRAAGAGPQAALSLARWRALWRLKLDGDLGFARGYIDGDWRTADLKGLLLFCARNEEALAISAGRSWLAEAINRVRHRAHANTRRGSRRNIAAHYDLGNAFYSAWLDRGMSYSSAIFDRGEETLEHAQDAKLDRAIDLLEISGGEGVLEIGCGFGALAERLVRAHRCSVTALTLSGEQRAHAQARLSDEIGSGAVDLRLQDYRDVHGRYRRIVSIEMLESVGERYWPIYFDKLRELLADDGIAVLQVITIDPQRFPGYRRRPDFIQRYIFPGGMLPTAKALEREAARAGLTMLSTQTFGQSYARTLDEWRRRFLDAWPAIQKMGFDARFRRMWEYYLAYCQVGFDSGMIDVAIGSPLIELQGGCRSSCSLNRKLEMSSSDRIQGIMRWTMSAFYLLAGIAHVAMPDKFLPIVPDWVPRQRETVLITGICEIAGSVGLLVTRLRPLAGIMLALYAICVFPANIKHALGSIRVPPVPESWWYHGPRLALQPVLVWWALFCAGVIDWPLRTRQR